MKLIKQQKVSSSQTDFNANLSVLGTFQIAEDAITEFMGDLKIDGLTAKREYNAVWVFSKTKIKFLKNVAWNSKYTATCFISKISNVTMDIDVCLTNADNEFFAYVRAELCAIDMSTGRIRKVSTVGINEKINAETPLLDFAFTKIVAENLPVTEEVKVGFTNIDYVGHTNNKEYVRFVLNTYTIREMADSPIREMEIVYANQSHEGDLLTIHKDRLGDKDLFAIQKDNINIIKCEILRDNSKKE